MDATPLTRLDNCPAPAKLNLFLHVVGRRADGYHLLQSAFRLLDWSDTLSFALREDGLVRRVTDVPGVPEEQDLVVRAARLLQQATGTRFGADIAIEKVLPMGGGLGGGSSDAATVLIALNRLWKTGLDREALAQLGLRLGADVPFFIFGRDAFVEGIGEKMQPIELPPAWYVIVAPPVTVPTAEIFSSKELTRNSEPVNIAVFAASATRNDLQAVACSLYPEVGAAIDWLAQFAPTRMTGSGACVFAEVGSEMEADEIVKSCPGSFRAWKAESLAQHPLNSWID
ncbi:4-(cytidine 5'-diphospho)-2-C-methyl-D-erythritol kinase [Azoarcus sp. KH32C]|uniref:4-(cytidine 5'-diphospho)-2-C-methyl-D-erythritol kinase n=1 Tax=Azoarcus sp. KH32C TaxID=748247 RepID=UPI0002386373|nr:4-(cytidine 5'-diphospho)-2-C-methyl-D-erythritol kinase [Azoarcus sp. KH32C]BAL23035.1 4-diphosphocytidyl-2-C-methyl-D-erythritol kinase [Azoarcus sp. KH32C]